ncbi:MAG: S8 family serine peptidase [Gammaproteobacteria bacterium]|nr:S8 family serine peptidase [Gammaproteobacteria bacterium]
MSEKRAVLTLWRNGESLTAVKVADQLSLRLVSGGSFDALLEQNSLSLVRYLARQNLYLVKVKEASQLGAAKQSLRSSPEVQFVSHVYSQEDMSNSHFYLMDQVTVSFSSMTTDASIEALSERYGLQLLKKLRFEHAYLFVLNADATVNPIKLCNALAEENEVILAEPNLAYLSQACQIPTDTEFEKQWHLNHNGGPFLNPSSHIDAPRAWSVTEGERSVVVALMDDSIELQHADFQGRNKTVAPVDFAERDRDPSPGFSASHGTACAGLAVAESNGRGVVGVAPNCALMPIRFRALDDDSMVEMFEWAVDHGASVISCSWNAGSGHFPLSLRQHRILSYAARKGRGGKGCVILFAAGNDNRPLNGLQEELWGSGRWHNGYAAHPDVIAVSACTSQAKKALYSNWGKEVSICAPSSNGLPQNSDNSHVRVRLRGRTIVTTDNSGSAGASPSSYRYDFGGTSAACPIAAGVAALVLSANPDLSAAEVKDILQRSADKIVDSQPRCAAG